MQQQLSSTQFSALGLMLTKVHQILSLELSSTASLEEDQMDLVEELGFDATAHLAC
jgi:hypothetical protein